MFKISRVLMDLYLCFHVRKLYLFSHKRISTLYYLECNVLRNPLRIALKFLMKITPHGKANPRPHICT
jgi:hypothetical protein